MRYFVIIRFVINFIGIYGNFMILDGSFVNSYRYNHKIDLVTSKYNCHGVHQLKFIFMNFISLV